MYIEQLYTDCLAAAAYYIESGGEAAVIDPMRDPQPYIDLAAKRGTKIKYIFETHFHSDFVGGHLDLAQRTGADIILGPGADAEYAIHVAADGEEFKLGFISLRVLHTPGHTIEACCFLLLDERQNPHSVFTGDTLFVDDVGRPDQTVDANLNIRKMAGVLYDSIENKLLSLPNYVIVYPAHGAGSQCGKSIGTERHSSIGIQKQTNYALKAGNKEEFIKLVTDGLNDPPVYFSRIALMNRKQCESFEAVLEKNLNPVSIDDLKLQLKKENTLVIDTRASDVFEVGFIPGSVFIGLDGSYAATAGSVVNPASNLIVVADVGLEKEAISKLARVGLENVAGYVEGGFASLLLAVEPIDKIKTISAEDFEELFRYNSCTVLDVRNPDEWVPGFVAGAKLIALGTLKNQLNELDRNKPCFIYCGNGYRSMVAASLLKSYGYDNVVNITGGMMKIRKTAISIKQLTSRAN